MSEQTVGVPAEPQRGVPAEPQRGEVRPKHGRSGDPPPAPEPLAVPVPDSHTHLDIVTGEDHHSEDHTGADRPGGGSVSAQIAAARAVGVDRLVQVGTDVGSSGWAARLARTHPEVLAVVGIHPNDAPNLPDLERALAAIDELADQPRVRGIGETGLDTFRTGPSGLAAQEASFRAHVEIAKRTGRALVIHDRDAHADILRVLDDARAPEKVVMHCFSGDAEFAEECLRRGFVLSFSGTITFRNAEPVRQAARLCPPDRLLVETDAPFLTPTPHRGRPNAPYLIPLTVRALAEIKELDLDRLCESISLTGERVFGGWEEAAATPAPDRVP